MFWKKDKPKVPAEDENRANSLFHLLAESLKKDGRIRAEDIITAAASVTAELCVQLQVTQPTKTSVCSRLSGVLRQDQRIVLGRFRRQDRYGTHDASRQRVHQTAVNRLSTL